MMLGGLRREPDVEPAVKLVELLRIVEVRVRESLEPEDDLRRIVSRMLRGRCGRVGHRAGRALSTSPRGAPQGRGSRVSGRGPRPARSLRHRRRPRGLRDVALLVAEVDAALLEHELLPLGRGEIDAVRVDELHRVLRAIAARRLWRPRRRGARTKLAAERRALEAGKVFLQEAAVDDAIGHLGGASSSRKAMCAPGAAQGTERAHLARGARQNFRHEGASESIGVRAASDAEGAGERAAMICSYAWGSSSWGGRLRKRERGGT